MTFGVELTAMTPYGRQAGSSRARVFGMVERTSHRVDVRCYAGLPNAHPSSLIRHARRVADAERALRRPSSWRALLLHREASPLSRGELETSLLRHADHAVYELDDALFTDTGSGNVVRRLAPKCAKAIAASQVADRVIAGSAVIAEWAARWCDDVVLIPTCIDADDYVRKASYQLSDPPRLGWVGSRDNERFLLLVAEALWEVHRRTGARLTLVGNPRRTLGALEHIIDRVAWSEDAQRVAIASFDVGLMPLPDDAYSRGKCAYKLLQYAAAGVPCVGSGVGANSEVLSRMAMPAPLLPADWADAIVVLLEMASVDRAAAGARAHAVAVADYSYDSWLPSWERAVGLTSRSDGAIECQR